MKLVALIMDPVEFSKFVFWSLFFIQSYDDKTRYVLNI